MIATKVIHTTRNDLSLDVRTRMIGMLNQHLANLSDLYAQTKHAHWNVQGAQFYSLHKLYDELAEALEDYIDDIAERAVQLGGEAAGTARMAAASSQLPEYPSGAFGELSSVQALAERYALAAKHARADIDVATQAGDQATADLLIEVVRGLDKYLWLLEAHLR